MNPNDCDHPDLTAHVLGELDAEHAEAVARWLASNPEARAEARQIGDLAQWLAGSAPVGTETLLPEQRAAVLRGCQHPADADQADLTAHVLGELDAGHSVDMARWLASNPEAQEESRQIGDLAQLLADTAPVSFHTLRPEQRAAVLSGPQRVRQMVAAVQRPRRPVVARSYPLVHGMVRLAAAACVATAAYVAGVHMGSLRSNGNAAVVASTSTAAVEKPEVRKTQPFRATEVPVVTEIPATDTPPAAVVATVEKRPEPKPETVVAVAPKLRLPAAPAPVKPMVAALPSNVILERDFVVPGKNNLVQVAVKPAATRPAMPAASSSGPVLGAPMTASRKDVPASLPKAPKQPELLIHSWKAEVVSCPWDEARRLVRVVLQIPGEQPAAAGSNSYPLQVSFNPGVVRSYRQLAERTIPAPQADAAAFHVAWFEVVPNGPLAEGATRTLGDLMLPNARFTTQAMAPFDSSKLHVLDRGATWQNAREDVLFETAVIGFGLLLNGEKETGSLNHAMVLELAQRAKAEEANAEHAKFIKLVREAGHAAGLK